MRHGRAAEQGLYKVRHLSCTLNFSVIVSSLKSLSVSSDFGHRRPCHLSTKTDVFLPSQSLCLISFSCHIAKVKLSVPC